MTSEWNTKPLGEIVSLVIDYRGKTPKKLGGDWSIRGIRALSAKNIKTREIVQPDTIRYVDSAMYKAWMKEEIQRGDILITSEAPFGEVFYWDSDEKIVLSQRLFAVRCKSEYYSPFIFQYMTSEQFQGELRGKATGTTVTGLRQPELLKCLVAFPKYEEQVAIAEMLSFLDARIAINKEINHHLEQIAQAIFKSWFVDFEPFGGEMPSDWSIIEFSTFLTPRIEKSSDPTIPLFSVTDTGIYPRGEKFNKKLSTADTKNKIARETDLIFGMSREILNWGIMRSPIGGVSSAYDVFAVDSGINSKYLESFIKSHSFYFKDLIRPATREGQGVDKGALMLKSIYFPPDEALAEYYAIEDALTTQIREKETESARLAELRDTLLPRLMSGELSVAALDDAK